MKNKWISLAYFLNKLTEINSLSSARGAVGFMDNESVPTFSPNLIRNHSFKLGLSNFCQEPRFNGMREVIFGS